MEQKKEQILVWLVGGRGLSIAGMTKALLGAFVIGVSFGFVNQGFFATMSSLRV
jgi:hypothetical protein